MAKIHTPSDDLSGGAWGDATNLRDNWHVAAEAALAGVRRDILQLALALQRPDTDATRDAAARLRRTVSAAHELAAALQFERGFERARQAIKSVTAQAVSVLGAVPPHDTALDAGTRPVINEAEVYAQDATLAHIDLDDLDLSRLWAHGCTFTNVTARRAVLDVAELMAARLIRFEAPDCSFASTTFDDAIMEDCDLTRADLMRTSWRRVTATRCKLTQAELVGARLDAAAFSDCDLRGADVSVTKPSTFATTNSTRFVRCDLRETNWSRRHLIGVSFYECKMFGAHGTPSLVGVVIDRPDMSPLGDKSKIGTMADVIAGWVDFVSHKRG